MIISLSTFNFFKSPNKGKIEDSAQCCCLMWYLKATINRSTLEHFLSSSNFRLAGVTHLNGKCEGHLGWWAAAAAAWTPQTQGSSRGGTELSWKEVWRWQVHIYILPLTESKILSNSREAVLFHLKSQSRFVSEWNASVSLPEETVTGWRTGSAFLGCS